MNATRTRLMLKSTLLAFVLSALPLGAQAAAPVPKAQQPASKLHKVSSFAPHRTKRRVFGAPIQPPIVTNPPPKPK